MKYWLTPDKLNTEEREAFEWLRMERDEIGSWYRDDQIVEALLYCEPGRSLTSTKIIIRGAIHANAVLGDQCE